MLVDKLIKSLREIPAEHRDDSTLKTIRSVFLKWKAERAAEVEMVKREQWPDAVAREYLDIFSETDTEITTFLLDIDKALSIPEKDRPLGWNPRWIEYADAHGKSPQQMLEHDRERYPGGFGAGFLIWMSNRNTPKQARG
jgi:hypothetical protein